MLSQEGKYFNSTVGRAIDCTFNSCLCFTSWHTTHTSALMMMGCVGIIHACPCTTIFVCILFLDVAPNITNAFPTLNSSGGCEKAVVVMAKAFWIFSYINSNLSGSRMFFDLGFFFKWIAASHLNVWSNIQNLKRSWASYKNHSPKDSLRTENGSSHHLQVEPIAHDRTTTLKNADLTTVYSLSGWNPRTK